MANTYYDSELTAEEIEEVLEAINGILNPANNGKVLAINNGKLEARSVQWGGGEPTIEPLSVTGNGTYTAPSGVDGYSPITVNVPGSSAVVRPLIVTQNGTYNPPSGVDGYAPVTVNVSGGSGDILTGTTAPDASIGNNGDIYKRSFPLPANVNFVEYLQSSGTQYIDTEITANQGTDFYAKCYKTGDVHIFGVRTGSGSSATNTLMVAVSANSIGASKTTSSVDQSTYRYEALDPTEVETKSILYSNGSYSAVSFFNGEAKNLRTPKQAAFQSNGSMVMFGARVNGIVNKSPSAKIYRLTIMQEHAPIADYLPCLDGNGVACMWDNIAGEYVYNDGTGDFAYGSAVTPDPLDDVYYLKENGAWGVIAYVSGITYTFADDGNSNITITAVTGDSVELVATDDGNGNITIQEDV